MTLLIRPMVTGDALAFLEVHRAAVRVTAAKDYPAEVIDAWAPLPLTAQNIERIRANPDDEIRIIAEFDSSVVGIGAIVVANSELRACYVRPNVGRRGVGSALVSELERMALERGCSELSLDSSITAQPFYLSQGYLVIGPGEHIFRSGYRMSCIKMRKYLRQLVPSH